MDSAAVVTPPHVGRPLRLAPFSALRLSPSKVADPSSGRAFARPYRDVADRMGRWQRRGFVERDTEPALYVHEYTVAGITVRGLVGALDVARRAARVEERAVFPHEGIYPAQADELADRMLEMGLNPAPILLVQHSPAPLRELLAQVRERDPDHAFVDRLAQAHRLWRVSEPDHLERIDELLAPTTAIIADGHHRYAAYLRLQTRHPGGALDRGLAMLVDQDDTPLFLGAIHRVLHGTTVADVQAAARSLGLHTTTAPARETLASLAPRTIVATDNECWTAIALGPGDRAEVEELHQRLVPAVPHGPNRVTYHHSVADARSHAQTGRSTAVLLPALQFDEVRRIVTADRLFPEKATSFQPKPALGVLIRSFHDEAAEPRSPRPRPVTRSRHRS